MRGKSGGGWGWVLVVVGLTSSVMGSGALAGEPSPASAPTFSREVAPILWQRCVQCHRAGEVAPFTLTSYVDAARRADQLVEVVRSRAMPPWHAAPEVGQFAASRWLADAEIACLEQWAAAGAPEGNPAEAPPLPKFPSGWQLGEPDLVLKMSESFALPTEGTNVLRWFPLAVNLPEDRTVAAFEFRPGNRRVVHHAVMFIDVTGVALKLDAKDPLPGYENFGGPGFLPTGYLGSWGPGYTPRFLPAGTGIRLSKRAVVALQMHYVPTGKPEEDQSEVALYFSKESETRMVMSIPLMSVGFEIPAGESRQEIRGEFTLPTNVTLISLAPHMHLLGKEMRVTAELPGGERRALIWVRDWDFNWQDTYALAEPIELPQGTRLEVLAYYDNTAGNPRNPYSPPQTVPYGQGSSEEMCLVGVQVALEQDGDFPPLVQAMVRQYLRSQEGKPFVNPFE